jgi:hypothetical protein
MSLRGLPTPAGIVSIYRFRKLIGFWPQIPLLYHPVKCRQIVAASVFDRLILVPVVLVPLAIASVFPHLFLAFAILDAGLAIRSVGSWRSMNVTTSTVAID